MQAIILAGGLGTRLSPLTDTRQKTLMPILNKPMVTYTLDMLSGLVDTAVIAVSYKADQVRAYAEQHAVDGMDIIVVEEREPQGTGGAIRNARRSISDRFLVFNGDIVSGLNVHDFVSFHEKHGGIGTIALHDVDEPEHYGVVALDGTRITTFVEKPPRSAAPSRHINAGTYCFEPAIFDIIPDAPVVSLERDVFPRIIAGGAALHGFPLDSFWYDVGRPETYLDIHRMLLRQQGHDCIAGADSAIDGALVYSSVGAATIVEPHALVEASVLLDNVTVGAATHIIESIVGEGCSLGQNVTVVNSILADGVTISDGAVIENASVAADGTVKKRF